MVMEKRRVIFITGLWTGEHFKTEDSLVPKYASRNLSKLSSAAFGISFFTSAITRVCQRQVYVILLCFLFGSTIESREKRFRSLVVLG